MENFLGSITKLFIGIFLLGGLFFQVPKWAYQFGISSAGKTDQKQVRKLEQQVMRNQKDKELLEQQLEEWVSDGNLYKQLAGQLKTEMEKLEQRNTAYQDTVKAQREAMAVQQDSLNHLAFLHKELIANHSHLSNDYATINGEYAELEKAYKKALPLARRTETAEHEATLWKMLLVLVGFLFLMRIAYQRINLHQKTPIGNTKTKEVFMERRGHRA